MRDSVRDIVLPSHDDMSIITFTSGRVAHENPRLVSPRWAQSFAKIISKSLSTSNPPWKSRLNDHFFIPLIRKLVSFLGIAETFVWSAFLRNQWKRTPSCVNQDQLIKRMVQTQVLHIKRCTFPVICNPVLKNSYHLPFRDCSSTWEGSHLRDNDILYVSRHVLIMQNHWVIGPNEDVNNMVYMICVRQ